MFCPMIGWYREGVADRREEGEGGAAREERRRRKVCKEEIKMDVMRI